MKDRTILKRTRRRLEAVVLSISLILVGSSCSDSSGDQSVKERETSETGYFVDEDSLGQLCLKSDVNYPVITEERTIDGANPSSSDATLLKLYQENFVATLGIYPRRLFTEIGLRKIVLCRRLSVDKIACFEFSDVEHGTMYINIDAGFPGGHLKRNLHHEVFHFIDFAEDHRLDEDRSWSTLNPATFVYGNGGGSMQNDPGAVKPDESLVGFVTRYATSGLAEDKAEVYAYLIFDGPWMIRRASTDPILGRKVEQVKTSLRRLGPLASGLLSRIP